MKQFASSLSFQARKSKETRVILSTGLEVHLERGLRTDCSCFIWFIDPGPAASPSEKDQQVVGVYASKLSPVPARVLSFVSALIFADNCRELRREAMTELQTLFRAQRRFEGFPGVDCEHPQAPSRRVLTLCSLI